ncbi:hypothetical protein KRMM14A1259_24310 [Krasilnikovia sp. MM14-A1259]
MISWIAATVTYAIITVYAWRASTAPTPDLHHVFGMWKWNDVNFYVEIAEYGYGRNADTPAFYPLYPMLIWTVDKLTPGDLLVAGAVTSSICAYLCMLLLHRFVDMEFGAKVASRTVIYFAAFPMAFFLYNAYNESLFILLSIGALYACRRGHWWLAGSLAGLAGATRLFGLLLGVPLAYEYLRQIGWRPRRIRWNALSLLLVPVGLAAYAVYCQVAMGNWRAFVDAQSTWKRAYGFPGQSLLEAIWLVIRQGPRSGEFIPNEYYLITLFEAAVVLGALILLVLGFVGPWKLRRDQYFLLVATAVPLLLVSMTMVGDQRWLQSAPRYAMEWVVAFIVLARIGGNAFVDRIYLMLGFSLQTLMLVTLVLQAHWVA